MIIKLTKNLTRLTFVTGFILVILVACNHSPSQRLKYGVVIQYVQDVPLNFPDVTLEFRGKTETPPSDIYPRSMYSYEFIVTNGNKSKIIFWSSGTGDIAPTVFEINDNKYALELAMSDKLGSLEKNELVLWRVDDW